MSDTEFSICLIARCPEHGLHGRRDSCFECGGPVEQVQMIALDAYEVERDAVQARAKELEAALREIGEAPPQGEGFPPLHWARDIARAALKAKP